VNSTDVIPSAAKSVSRMIATYATPIVAQSPKKNSGMSPQRSSISSPGHRPSSRNARSQTLVDISGSPTMDANKTKPGIQCDLRRALSLDYQKRFAKLDISAEQAGYTQGAPLARRSADRKRRDLSENLANRLLREQIKNPSFYDIV